MKPAEVSSISDHVFSTSFVLFRLCAGLSFSFENVEQNGTASVHFLFCLFSLTQSDVKLLMFLYCSGAVGLVIERASSL